MKKTVYILAIVLLLVVFGVSAFMVGSYILEGKEQAEKYDSLAALKDSVKENATTPANQTTDPTDPEGTFGAAEIRDENGMLVEYGELYAMNPDIVGWIRMDGTEMNYPVMQTPDRPNHYLYKDFEGNGSARGSIYIREECDMFEPSDNITVYGHNMRDGSMFACLNAYMDKNTIHEVYENNSLIFFDTLYEYHVYKIFAVFKTTATVGKGFKYHNMIDAENKEDFDEFIATCKQLCLEEYNFDSGITPQYGDKIICLSTCEYTLENGRFVVAAVRIS